MVDVWTNVQFNMREVSFGCLPLFIDEKMKFSL